MASRASDETSRAADVVYTDGLVTVIIRHRALPERLGASEVACETIVNATSLGTEPTRYLWLPHLHPQVCFPVQPVASVQARLCDVAADTALHRIEGDPHFEHVKVVCADDAIGSIKRSPGSTVAIGCERGEIVAEADYRRIALYEPAGGNPYLTCSEIEVALRPEGLGKLAAIATLVGCLANRPGGCERNAALKRDTLTAQTVLFAMVHSHLEGARPVAFGGRPAGIDIQAKSGGCHA